MNMNHVLRGLGAFALALAAATGAHAQDEGSGFTPFLNASSLQDLASDGDGGLWIASNGGALRFDRSARTWEIYPRRRGAGPVGNHVSTVAVDPTGRVWVGTLDAGVSTYDPLNDRWERFEEIPDARIRIIRAAGESVYIGTEAGLAVRGRLGRTDVCNEIDSGCIVPSYVVNDYAELAGVLWVATSEGLGRFDGTIWTEEAALPAGSLGHPSLSLAVYQETLWEATPDSVRRLVSGIWESEARAFRRLMASSGRLFAITEAGGVAEYTGGAWQGVALPAGLATIRDLEVEDGTFYFATDRGLHVWNPAQGGNGRLHVPPGPQIPDFHRGLAIDSEGTVWVGNTEGVLRYDGAAWEYFQKGGASGLDGEWVFSMTASADGVVVGHCCCNDPPRCRTDVGDEDGFVPAPAYDVWALDMDPSGRIWAGTDNDGVYVLENRDGSWETALRITDVNSGLNLRSNGIRAIEATADGVYFGHETGLGIDYWQLDGSFPADESAIATTGSWRELRVSSGLLDGSMASLEEARGNVYAGSSTALHRIAGGVIIDAWPTNFSSEPGDLPRVVRAIVVDRSGGIWAGTNNGVLYRGSIQAPDFRAFHTGNSDLPSDDVYSGELHPDGSVWFGTAEGIVRIDPERTLGRRPSQALAVYPNPIHLQSGGAPRVTLGTSTGGGPATGAPENIREVVVYDVSGRTVGRFNKLTSEWQWDLRNDSGDLVTPGVYLIRVRTAEGGSDLKLGILR